MRKIENKLVGPRDAAKPAASDRVTGQVPMGIGRIPKKKKKERVTDHSSLALHHPTGSRSTESKLPVSISSVVVNCTLDQNVNIDNLNPEGEKESQLLIQELEPSDEGEGSIGGVTQPTVVGGNSVTIIDSDWWEGEEK